MERYVYQSVPLKKIRPEFPFACRGSAENPALKKSMERSGLVTPVVLLGKKDGYVMLSGHARLGAAASLGWVEIPAAVVSAEKTDKEWFLFSVLSNWNQPWKELDGCFAVKRALDLDFSEKEIVEDILPALGLSPEKKWIQEAKEILSMDPGILKAAAAGNLPYRGIRSLAVFKPEDQRDFAVEIAARLPLTSNQLIQTSEWLFDLMKAAKSGLKAYLGFSGLQTILSAEGSDGRQKAERFCKALRKLRFPQLAAREDQFASAAEKLAQEGRDARARFVLEPPPSFEAEGLTLKAVLKDPEALDRLTEVLKRKRNLFNSLFDIML